MPEARPEACAPLSVLQALRRIERLAEASEGLPEFLRDPECLFFRMLRDLPSTSSAPLPSKAGTPAELVGLFTGLSSDTAKVALEVYAAETGGAALGQSVSVDQLEPLRDWVLQERQACLRTIITLCGLGSRSTPRGQAEDSGAAATEADKFIRESIVNIFSGINGAKTLVEILLENMERIVSRRPLFLQVSQAEPALSLAGGSAEFRDILARHEVACSSAALSELELSLDALIIALVSGASLKANQLVRLVAVGARAQFQAPLELLQCLPSVEGRCDACGRLALAWTLCIAAGLQIRASFSQPSEKSPFFEKQRLCSKELSDLADVLSDCVRLGSAVISDRNYEDWYRTACANMSFLLAFIFGVYSSLTVDRTSPVASRFDELVTSCSADSSLPVFGHLMSLHFPGPVAKDEAISVAGTIFELKAGIVQQLIDAFLIPVFRDADAGKGLAAANIFPKLVCLSFRCDAALCSEFWRWWRYFKSVPADELIRWTYRPYLLLYRLINQYMEASHERHFFMEILSGLVCDSQSFDDCLALLAAPIVLKSWETQRSLVPFDPTDAEGRYQMSPGDRAVCRRFGAREIQALGSPSDVIARAPSGAVGIILCKEAITPDLFRYLLRWEDRCCSSWWGLCIASILTNDSSVEFRSALKLLASLMRFEGSNSLMKYLDEHYIDLFSFHVVQHLGLLDGAGDVAQILRANNLHARAVARSLVNEMGIAFSIHRCTRLSEDLSIKITQAFKFYFTNFSEILSRSSVVAMVSNLAASTNAIHNARSTSLLNVQGNIDDGAMDCLRIAEDTFNLLQELVSGNYSVYTVPSILTETCKTVPELICALLDRAKTIPLNKQLLNTLFSSLRFFESISANLISNAISNPLVELFFRMDSRNEGVLTREMVERYCIEHSNLGCSPQLLINEVFFADRSPSVDLSTFLANCQVLSSQEDLARIINRFGEEDYAMYYFIQAMHVGNNPPNSARQEYLRSILDVCMRCIMLESVPSPVGFADIIGSEDVKLYAMTLVTHVLRIECPSEHVFHMQQLIVDHFIVNRSFQDSLAQNIMEVLTNFIGSSFFSKYIPKSEKFVENDSDTSWKSPRYEAQRYSTGSVGWSGDRRARRLEKLLATLRFLENMLEALTKRKSSEERLSMLSFVGSPRAIGSRSVHSNLWSVGGALVLFVTHDREKIARTAVSLLSHIFCLSEAVSTNLSTTNVIRDFFFPYDIMSFVANIESMLSPKVECSPRIKASLFIFLRAVLRADSILLSQLLLVPSKDANAAEGEGLSTKPPLGAGHRSSAESSQAARTGALTAATTAVFNAINAQRISKREESSDDLELLDSALSFLVDCWDSFRSNFSVVVAKHILYIAENSAFWSILTSVLLRDLPAPILLSEPQTLELSLDGKSDLKQNLSIQMHCRRLSIMSTAFGLVARERFGLLFAAEDIVFASEDSSSSREGDLSFWKAAGSSRKKIDEFFRHCSETNRFIYWLKLCAYHSYDIASVERIAKRNALALGLNVSLFRRSSRSHVAIDSLSYVYDLASARSAATSRGWRRAGQAFNFTAMPGEHNLWEELFRSLIKANSLWAQVDSHTHLMKKFRDFIEITVLPPPSVTTRLPMSVSSSPGQLRRSPSLGPDSPRRNQPPLSPSINKHLSGMPSPSATPLLHLPPSMGAGEESSFFGDKRSYVVAFDILKHLDREFSKWREDIGVLGQNDMPSLFCCEAVPGMVESVALMTSMLHHQLKDVSVRTADPTQATLKMRDSKALRFDASQLHELLDMLCRVYGYLFNILSEFMYIKSENCLNYWGDIWGRIGVDLMSCIVTVVQALGGSGANADKIANNTRCSSFKCIFDVLRRELKENEISSLLSDEIISDQCSSCGRHKSPFESNYLIPSFVVSEGYNFLLERPGIPNFINKSEAERVFRASLQESLLSKRSILTKLSLQALAQLLLGKDDLQGNPLMPSMWKGFVNASALTPFIELLAELLSRLPKPSCDYSSWSSQGRGEPADCNADSRSSYFSSAACIMDLMINAIDDDILGPEDPSIHTLTSLMINCRIFKEYQSCLLPVGLSESAARRVAAFMPYDDRTGDDSAVCGLWAKTVRLVASAIEAAHRRTDITAHEPKPIPIGQIFIFFVEKYAPLLMLPLKMSDFSVSCGQLKLAKSTFAFFNALEDFYPLWRTVVPHIGEHLNRSVLSSLAYLSNLLSEGKSIQLTARNVRSAILFVTEEEKRGGVLFVLSGNESLSRRSTVPPNEDGIVRTNSFDSTSTEVKSSNNEGPLFESGVTTATISKPIRFVISMVLDSIMPALSLLRNMLPCPLSSHPAGGVSGCSHALQAQLRVRPEVGVRVAFMTKRWVPFASVSHLTGDSKVDYSFISETPAPVMIDVIEQGKIVKEVPLPMIGSDAFSASFRSGAPLDARSAYVYSVLLDNGSVEEGVSFDAIVAASVPLLPLTASAKVSFGQQFLYSNEALVQLLCFITSDEMVHMRRGYRSSDSPGARAHTEALDALLDAIAGHLLICIAAAATHIDASLNAPIDECPIGNLALQRTELCAQMNAVLRCFTQRHRAEESTAIAWFCTAEWTEFLSVYEPIIEEIVRRNASPEFAALAFDTTIQSSPSQPEWAGKLTDGSLRTGPEYVDL